MIALQECLYGPLKPPVVVTFRKGYLLWFTVNEEDLTPCPKRPRRFQIRVCLEESGNYASMVSAGKLEFLGPVQW
jgi:hypothetical protein